MRDLDSSAIFYFWETLSAEKKALLEKQLSQINLETLEKQRELLQKEEGSSPILLETFDEFSFSGDSSNYDLGEKLIREGRVGTLLLAGGQGTRLQHSGPKGTYPISVIKHKSLFQLCAEKVKAASQWANRLLNLAIMTSPDNDEETRKFFQHHQFFGLEEKQITIFVQKTLPMLDAEGKLFLKTPWQIASGADGNGNALIDFAKVGILNEWIQKGIDYLNVILIDNPLADPFDPELVGFHHQKGVKITLKCTEKTYPQEKVGVIVKQNEACRVIEYSEISEEEKVARREDGKLKHCCANLSLFCFSLSFIQQIIETKKTLPLHKAWKGAQYVDQKGISHLSSRPMAWKFETFIFDWIPYAKKVAALLYPREQCFAPLKNFQGSDSPQIVKEALQKRERMILKTISGIEPPSFPFELAPEFYYPTQSLINKWKGKQISSPFVDF